MSESFVSASGKCAKCGGDLETTDDVRTDDSIVTCKACGERIGTYGEVNAKMREAAFAGAREAVTTCLNDFRRGLKSINLKL